MGFTNPAAVSVSGNFGPWTAYTPAFGSTGAAPTMLAANRNGWYTQLGKLVIVHARFAWTAIGAGEVLGTGNYRFGLPIACSANYIAFDRLSSGHMWDVSASRAYTASAVLELNNITCDLYTEGGGACGAAAPVVPTNGDFYALSLMYEAV